MDGWKFMNNRRIKINLNRPQPLQQIHLASASPFTTFSSIVDPAGNLKFEGKASVGSEGIKFENGTMYQIKLDDFQFITMLGKGQFGIVQKVLHRPSQVIMALKEIRLELDQHKLNHIIMELDVLHRSRNPYIIDFFGAFVLENCVYMSLEYMDAGSLDRLYHGGIPENVLAKIATSVHTYDIDGFRSCLFKR
jgi:mitogen-activated protein kinase kinase